MSKILLAEEASNIQQVLNNIWKASKNVKFGPVRKEYFHLQRDMGFWVRITRLRLYLQGNIAPFECSLAPRKNMR